MTRTILALDHEFAVATGANVNSSPGLSTFDYPPNGTSDLVITSQSRDDAPFAFRIGDVYDVSFQGNGAAVLTDAIVIRSDHHEGGGAVVFEGTDEGGSLVQVVWSPDFDLETWYWDNFAGGAPPQFYTTEQDSGTYRHVCFGAGTRIATPRGDVPVQDLHPGLEVTTRDNGARPVLWLGHRDVAGIGPAAPVVIEVGAIGNNRRLTVSQQHRLMLSHPLAELYFGHPEVFVPAKALVNGRDIRIEARQKIRYYHALLSAHEVLTAEGAAAESLFLGDMALDRLPGRPLREVALHYPDLAGWAKGAPMQIARPSLSFYEARFLAATMGIADSPAKAPPPWLIAA